MVHVAASVSDATGNVLKSQPFAAGLVVSASCSGLEVAELQV